MAKALRIIFNVTTPLGYKVVLTRNRWREITRYKHPALSAHLNKIRGCLSAPDLVRQSAKDADVHLYYLGTGGAYVCVVVGCTDTEERFVITAYFSENIKGGNQLWTK